MADDVSVAAARTSSSAALVAHVCRHSTHVIILLFLLVDEEEEEEESATAERQSLQAACPQGSIVGLSHVSRQTGQSKSVRFAASLAVSARTNSELLVAPRDCARRTAASLGSSSLGVRLCPADEKYSRCALFP